MRMIIIGGKRFPLGDGMYRLLLEFLADPTVDEKGCHPWRGTGANVLCPDRALRTPKRIAYEVLIGDTAPSERIALTCDGPSCVNVQHMIRGRSTACGNGHPWTEDTIYEVVVVRAGKRVVERQCRLCRNARKRESRQLRRPQRTPLWATAPR